MCSGLRSHLRTRFGSVRLRSEISCSFPPQIRQLEVLRLQIRSITSPNPKSHQPLQASPTYRTSPPHTGPTLSPGSTKLGFYLTNSASRAIRYSIGLFPLIQTPYRGLPPIPVRSRGGFTRSAATPTIAGRPRAASRRRVTLGPPSLTGAGKSPAFRRRHNVVRDRPINSRTVRVRKITG
jgi:hypothetical protein